MQEATMENVSPNQTEMSNNQKEPVKQLILGNI